MGGDAELPAELFGQLLFPFLVDGLGGDFDFEDVSVDHAGAQEREYPVGVAGPDLEGGPDIVVVQLDEVFQGLGAGVECCSVDVVVEEESQGGGGEELRAASGEFLGAEQGADEHPFVGHGGLVEVDLPIHEPAGGEEVFDGVDAFGFDHEVVVFHVEHLDDACGTDVAFAHAGVEAVAPQVVESVHVQLPADELVEEAFRVFVLEDADGEGGLSVRLLVDAFHQHQGDVFVRHAAHDGVFEHVREGAVADVVHEDGGFDGFGFAVEDEVALGGEVLDGFARQVEGAQGVLEAGVLRAGVDHGREAQLLDAVQPLQEGMPQDVVQQALGDIDEPEDGVVDDFSFVGHG